MHHISESSTTIRKHPEVAEYYNDTIVPAISNTDYTFGYTNDQDTSLRALYKAIGDANLCTDSTTYDLYVDGLGRTRVYKYKVSGDNYWVFGSFDGYIIARQRHGLSIIVFLSLFSTAILNLIIIYKINQSIWNNRI
jgi:hypothetical protein